MYGSEFPTPAAGSAQTYDDVVLSRRSIRGYKPDPVPEALVREILQIAIRAPSNVNTQPWNFYVITGAPLDRIRAENLENAQASASGVHSTYDGVHRARQIEIAKQLFGAMGIERHDQDKRRWWVLRGFRQYDAPVSIVVTYDRTIGSGPEAACFDCGSVTNALVNAAWARGLGCVINGQGTLHPAVLREHGQIPDDQAIMTCVAMGYPDDTFAANAVVSTRKSVDEAAVFIGFEA
ncbi:MAG TPA: nitroreductase [Caulobacteraceae bacterium]